MAALLAACGGGGGDGNPDTVKLPPLTGAPTNADAADDADAATHAQIAAVIASTEAAIQRAVRGTGNPAPIDIPRRPFGLRAEATEAAGWNGLYPGLLQSNLVANTTAYGARIVEPLLQDAWGIAIRPAGFGGHFWLGAAGTGKSIEYVGDVGGTPLFQDALTVVDTAGPVTGVAFNPGAQFVITQDHPNGAITNGAKFLFANASGTITAWTERARPGGGFDFPADAVTVVDGMAGGASFLGVTVAPGNQRMLAADFGDDAQLRAYDGKFAELPALPNIFRPDGKKVSGGFEAFNVQTVGQSVFAMYSPHLPMGSTATPPPQGRLVEFDAEGRVVARWRGRGYLNSPWGIAQAPQNYGLYGGCLLVGNFGDGTIVAFHPRLKAALDYVRDADGKRVVIDGLWGLQFGNGASLGEADHMYFAAGPNKELDGLFGKLVANGKALPFIGGLSLCR